MTLPDFVLLDNSYQWNLTYKDYENDFNWIDAKRCVRIKGSFRWAKRQRIYVAIVIIPQTLIHSWAADEKKLAQSVLKSSLPFLLWDCNNCKFCDNDFMILIKYPDLNH